MRTTWIKMVTSFLCCVAMLCALMSVGVSADNGLEIFDGEDKVYLSVAMEFYPFCGTLPDGVTEEDLIWTVKDTSVLAYREDGGYFQALTRGETVLTAATADGVYTDNVKIVVLSPTKMTNDTYHRVFINYAYTCRTLQFTTTKDGIYFVELLFPSDAYGYGMLYNQSYELISLLDESEYISLSGNQTYYVVVAGVPANGVGFEMSAHMRYAWESIDEPDRVEFSFDTYTITQFDVASLPTYIFKPGFYGYRDDYDTVTFSEEGGNLLQIDNEAGTMYATQAGTTTLQITADTYGWTDTVKINVENNNRILRPNEPMDMYIKGNEMKMAYFMATETKEYAIYSVANDGVSDPACVLYDMATGEMLAYGDDENGKNFVTTVHLTEGQYVMMYMSGYSLENTFTVYMGEPAQPTGVQLVFDTMIDRRGDTVYMAADSWVVPRAVFFGETPTKPEPYEIITDMEVDEYGGYYFEAGQSGTFTVTSESGLTDTVTVKAVKICQGDVTFDGKVNLADGTTMFYMLNGQIDPNPVTYAAMEIDGDNNVTTYDLTRLFYYINGKIQSL